jgi:hypothetical protein
MYGPAKVRDVAYIKQRLGTIKRETEMGEQDWLAAEAALEAAE